MLIVMLLVSGEFCPFPVDDCGGAMEFMPSGYFSLRFRNVWFSFTNFVASDESSCFSTGNNWKSRKSYIELNATPPFALDMAMLVGCGPPAVSCDCCLVFSSTA